MKIITVETLKAFLDELNKKYGTEFYSKAESDERYQPKGESSGGDVDYQELARRIPSWQWKVTLPKSEHQTVTATVNGRTYTSDFYAQQGSQVTFSARGDAGYTAGTVSPTSATLDNDLTVTVTAATESENIEAGTKTFNGGTDEFIVPPKVQTVKWTWNGKDTYAKVTPGQRFTVATHEALGAFVLKELYYINTSGRRRDYRRQIDPDSAWPSMPLTVSWSEEINEHAIDYDWTN